MSVEKDYTIEINELLLDLDNIDASNTRQVLLLENIVKKVKKFITNKGELSRCYNDRISKFNEFTKTKQYELICEITEAYLEEIIKIYKADTKNTPPKFITNKDRDDIITNSILHDYIYSMLYFSTSFWLIDYIKLKNLSYTLKNRYDGIIDFYSSISMIILSLIESKNETIINSSLYLMLQDSIKDFDILFDDIELYLFDSIASSKKHNKYMDSHGTRLLYKSIIYKVLSKLKSFVVIIDRAIPIHFNDDNRTAECNGFSIEFEPAEYKAILACVNVDLKNKYDIKSDKISKINKKFGDNDLPPLISRKNSLGLYMLNYKNYNVR